MREERGEVERTQAYLQHEREQGRVLADELQDYRDFIDSIPEDVFEELKRRYEMQLQGAGHGQEFYLAHSPTVLDRLVEIAKVRSTAASNEIEAATKQLVDSGELVKHGAGRAAFYTRKDAM